MLSPRHALTSGVLSSTKRATLKSYTGNHLHEHNEGNWLFLAISYANFGIRDININV